MGAGHAHHCTAAATSMQRRKQSALCSATTTDVHAAAWVEEWKDGRDEPPNTMATDALPNPNKQFVKQLRNVGSVKELEQLVDDAGTWSGGGSGLDAQSVTAIASKLSQLACSSSSRRSDSASAILMFLSHRWLPLLEWVAPDLDAAGVCICASAVAHISHDAGGVSASRAVGQAAELLMDLWEALTDGHSSHRPVTSSSSRSGATPRAAAQLLWALARMGADPPKPWLHRWSAATLHLLPGFNAKDLSMSLWACATLGWVPGPRWLRGGLTVLRARVHLMGPQPLATCVWALARLACAPPPELLDAVLLRATQLLLQPVPTHDGQGSKLQEACCDSMAASQLQGESPAPASIGCLPACGSSLVAQPQALAMLVYALAMLQHQPSSAFVSGFVAAAPGYLPAARPQVCI